MSFFQFDNISEFTHPNLFIPSHEANNCIQLDRSHHGALLGHRMERSSGQHQLLLFSLKKNKYRLLMMRESEHLRYADFERLKKDFLEVFQKNSMVMKKHGFDAIGYEQYQCKDLQISKFCQNKLDTKVYCFVLKNLKSGVEEIIPNCYSPLQALFECFATHFELLPSQCRDSLISYG